MSIMIRVLANTFPSICIVMGVLLLFGNKPFEGGGLVVLGALFQAFYLKARYGD